MRGIVPGYISEHSALRAFGARGMITNSIYWPASGFKMLSSRTLAPRHNPVARLWQESRLQRDQYWQVLPIVIVLVTVPLIAINHRGCADSPRPRRAIELEISESKNPPFV